MKQRGFTLIELIVALAFFSFMLLIVSAGFLQVSRIYQSGVASRRTQQAARAVMNDIAQEVRAATAIEATGDNNLCLRSGQAIEYVRDSVNNTLTKGHPPNCGGSLTDGVVLVGSEGNLGSNVIIRRFETSAIEDGTGTPISVEVTVQITTGINALFSGDACDPTDVGSQFCSTTTFTNTISLRGDNAQN